MKNRFPLLACLLMGLLPAAKASVPDRDGLLIEVNSCYAILQEFMANPATAIPPTVLQKAKALLITNQFKGGFILGINGGYGVILAKRPDGHWSLPVLVSANEASVGFQLGAKSVEAIYVMTDDQTPRLLYNKRFNIGVDAKAVAGPHAADVERMNKPILATPVLVYTKEKGLFAGATITAGQVARNDAANQLLYATSYTLPELLYSDWVKAPAEVQPFIDYVQRLSP